MKNTFLSQLKNLKFVVLSVCHILAVPLMAQTVSNVQAEQVGKKIVITYTLDQPTYISVCYSLDGGKTLSSPLKQVSGDVGKNIAAGNHSITWNVLEEVDKLIAEDIIFVVIPAGQTLTFTVKDVTFTMVKVAGGTFTMGATKEQGDDAGSGERPAHQVTLSDYYIGQTEVTQALWEAVMGESVTHIANRKGKSTYGVGADYPMYYISYDDCTTFVNKLNTLLSSQLGGKRFALPTEAQWEFAARGGNKSKGYKYAGSNNLDDVAWYNDNSGRKTHPVAKKQPNELGLYDMSGNVHEWCKDWAGDYSSNAQTNPQGPADGLDRAFRGGSWFGGSAKYCRVSIRYVNTPANRNINLGLRLCLLP